MIAMGAHLYITCNATVLVNGNKYFNYFKILLD